MKKQFAFIHISGRKDDIVIISVSNSLVNAMRKAEKFTERHKYDDDAKFQSIEQWEINSKADIPKEVWEYERTRVDKPKRWVKLEELTSRFRV
jgi:hypothetical protein